MLSNGKISLTVESTAKWDLVFIGTLTDRTWGLIYWIHKHWIHTVEKGSKTQLHNLTRWLWWLYKELLTICSNFQGFQKALTSRLIFCSLVQMGMFFRNVIWLGFFMNSLFNDNMKGTRSLGALRVPTSSWRPFGPLDFVLRALQALRLCDPHR